MTINVNGRPMPEPDNVSAPYWAGAAEGKVLYQECPACGHRQFYPRAMCTACTAEPEWREASGRGNVHTYTVIRQNWANPFQAELPYIVAMVELEEGVKMMSNITDCPVEDVHIGMAVEAYTVKVDDEVGIPFWRPVSKH